MIETMNVDKDLQRRFEDLIAYISKANEAVLGGKIHRLEELDRTVEKLCHDTLSGDAEIAKDMQPLMAETISLLDELERNLADLKKQHKSAST